MPLKNSLWHVWVKLYSSSFQYVELKISKWKLLLNHYTATAFLGVSFIMYFHMFLFLFKVSNVRWSFVAGANVAPFKYIGNTTSKICTRYTTLIFFISFLVTYIEYLYFIKFLCADNEINPGPFNWCKSISFYHWNLNGLLDCNCKKFLLVEAFDVLHNIGIFCISKMFPDSSVNTTYDESKHRRLKFGV